jgi:hypothetical protein
MSDGKILTGTIVDLSAGGARIKLQDTARVEPEFDLEIPDDDVIIRCRLAHVDDVGIGAQYIKPPRRISWLKR